MSTVKVAKSQRNTEASADQERAPSTDGGNGRDAHGKFTKGNAGGPGNPFARQVAALRSALVRAVSAQDIDDIAMALIIRAKAGDVAAAKLLFSYCIGKPAETVEPDRLDVDEWELVQQTTTSPTDVQDTLEGMPVDLASKFINLAMPGIGAGMQQMIHDRLKFDAPPTNGSAKTTANGSAPSTIGGNGHDGRKQNGRQRPPKHRQRPPESAIDWVKRYDKLLED